MLISQRLNKVRAWPIRFLILSDILFLKFSNDAFWRLSGNRLLRRSCRTALRGVLVGSRFVSSSNHRILYHSHVALSLCLLKFSKGLCICMPPSSNSIGESAFWNLLFEIVFEKAALSSDPAVRISSPISLLPLWWTPWIPQHSGICAVCCIPVNPIPLWPCASLNSRVSAWSSSWWASNKDWIRLSLHAFPKAWYLNRRACVSKLGSCAAWTPDHSSGKMMVGRPVACKSASQYYW